MLAYFDCFSGISGDMTLGALVDAGVDLDLLRGELARLPVRGYRLSAERVRSKGLQGTLVRVDLDPDEPQPHRHLSDVLAIIEGSTLDPAVKARATAVFRRLAAAEAKVHGTTVEEVHFHEVGAVDAIVDVVGAIVGLNALGVERAYASSLPTGSGTVQTAHGLLPVPAPATLELLTAARAPMRPSEAQTELVTPTGAALLAELAEFQQPALRLARVGIGFGQKQLPWANCLRLILGDPVDALPRDGERDEIVVLEANLDDTTPEMLGAAMGRLFEAGALDVYFTPIQMKKNRPAVLLSVLAPVDLEKTIAATVLRETTTLGVRVTTARRLKGKRWQETVDTPWGEVRVKMKAFDGQTSAAPEYDDCLRVADDAGVTVGEVYDAAKASAARRIGAGLRAASR